MKNGPLQEAVEEEFGIHLAFFKCEDDVETLHTNRETLWVSSR